MNRLRISVPLLRAATLLSLLICAALDATAQDATATRPRRARPAPVVENASEVDANNAKPDEASGTNETSAPAANEAAPRAANDDQPSRRAHAETLVREERYAEALPLLVTLTDEAATSTPPDARTRAHLYALRGLAELRVGKPAAAVASLDRATRLDARNASALFYRARLAYDANELSRAVVLLNRATLVEPRFTDAWRLLAIAYLRRAADTEAGAAATEPAAAASPKTIRKQDAAASAAADRLSAVRAGDALIRAEGSRPTPASVQLHAQTLIAADQFARAALTLEVEIARIEPAQPEPATLYLLGVAHSRTKNYEQAIRRLEQAAARSADDPSIHAELGYAYEVTRAYPAALKAYRRAAELAPDDMELTSAVARVRPLVK